MQLKNRGFTLLELMVGIVIMGIIGSIAMTNFGTMLESDRAQNFVTEFTKNLKFARAKASSVDEIVVVCPLNSSNTCDSDWISNQVVVFVDSNNDGKRDASEQILRTMDKLHNTDKFLHTSGSGAISYNGQGRIAGAHTFVYCPNGKAENNAVFEITASGKTWNAGRGSAACTS